jgi:Domain of unknown function (DUF3854)
MEPDPSVSDRQHPCYQLLLPQHVAFFNTRGIAPEQIEARGYRSIDRKVRLKELGFSPAQRGVPTLLIPVYGVTGELVTYQIRPDDPRLDDKNKPRKYETLVKSRMALDVPRGIRHHLGDPKVDLFITEGPVKADAAVGQSLCCIAVLGVWNWRGTNEHGGKTALPDWEMIALDGREVYVCFDSDVMSKPQVYSALVRLKRFLEMKGARVYLIYLPAGETGAKVGLDDYFAAGHTTDEFLSLAIETLRDPPADGDEAHNIPYEATGQGIVWFKGTKDGVVEIPLTNFTAQIIADTVEDDGVETRRTFGIEARLNGSTRRFTIAAEHFAGMSWATEHLGAEAMMYPGMMLRDHARAAVQLLSLGITERRVFKHTGWWQNRDGAWFYFHGGGVLGENGLVPDMDVALPDGLHHFVLPDPPHRADLVKAINASRDMLDIAPDRITVPVWASIWRAVLGGSDFSTHLSGPTGTRKTATAALAQQHFGAGFDARHLPAGWSSTGNSLEGQAFAMKDALLVIDDFAPGGSQTDVARMHREADRVLRAQGNLSGRQRMRPDGSLRLAKPPRGLILSTGEDVPRGQSLRGRIFTVEVSPGEVDLERLTHCQEAARAGMYAEALVGFLQWLAPRYAQVRQQLRDEIVALRPEADQEGQHPRTPEIVANLAVGVRYFLNFACDAGALTAEEIEAFWHRCWAGLTEAAGAQRQYQEAGEPTQRFMELLTAALASGRAHVASPNGQEPKVPESWGWRKATVESGPSTRDEWRPQGRRVGWVDGEHLYLEPEASYAEVQALAVQQGEAFPVTASVLRKRLYERHLLLATAGKRQTYTLRRMLEGMRRPVLCMRVDTLSSYNSKKPAQSAQEDKQDPENEPGQVPGQVFSADMPAKIDAESNGYDHVGRLGRVWEDIRAENSERDVPPFLWAGHSENLPTKPAQGSKNLPNPSESPDHTNGSESANSIPPIPIRLHEGRRQWW